MIYLMIVGNRFRRQLVTNVELTNEALQSIKALVSRQLISELIVKIQSAYLDKNFSIEKSTVLLAPSFLVHHQSWW